jgi:aminotransferase
LAGWRLGFLAAPEEFISEALKVQDSSVICAAHAAQYALAQTLRDVSGCAAYLEEKRALLAKRRDALLKPFDGDGRFDVHTPGGACFAFVGLPEGTDAEEFAWDLLSAQGVVAVPGIHFGPEWRRYLRLSFGSGTEEELEEAGRRIVGYLEAQ